MINLQYLPDYLLDWTSPHQMLSVHHRALDLEVCEDCVSMLGRHNYKKILIRLYFLSIAISVTPYLSQEELLGLDSC